MPAFFCDKFWLRTFKRSKVFVKVYYKNYPEAFQQRSCVIFAIHSNMKTCIL